MRYAHVSQHKSVEATFVATSSRQDLHVSAFIPATTGGKRQGLQDDRGRDVHKRQQRTGNIAEGVPQISMSSKIQGTHATLLLLTLVTALPEKFLHMELKVPVIVEQRRRRTMYRQKCTLFGSRSKQSS